jgi:hypothetical protein
MIFGSSFDKHLLILALSIAIPSLIIGFVLGAWIF